MSPGNPPQPEFLKISSNDQQPNMMSDKPIRWTLHAAQKEFGPHRDTIKAKLVQAGQSPAADGTYSTQQITTSLMTETHRERIRKIRGERERLELENQRTRESLIPVEQAIQIAQRFAAAASAIAVRYRLSPDEKKAFLEEMQALAAVDWSNLDAYFDEEGGS